MDPVFNIVPYGVMQLIKEGLKAKFSLQYSGVVKMTSSEAGPLAYSNKDKTITLLVFDGTEGGTSEYALITNSTPQEAEAQVTDFAGKYGDVLANFITPTKLTFQKASVGETWASPTVDGSGGGGVSIPYITFPLGNPQGCFYPRDANDTLITLNTFDNSQSVRIEIMAGEHFSLLNSLVLYSDHPYRDLSIIGARMTFGAFSTAGAKMGLLIYGKTQNCYAMTLGNGETKMSEVASDGLTKIEFRRGLEGVDMDIYITSFELILA